MEIQKQTAENLNILGRFLGKRDVEELSAKKLEKSFGISKADVMVLFGGSILCGGDVLAKAMEEGIARSFVIVGGEGHTTETLRRKVRGEYPELETEGLSEAEVFSQYLERRYGKKADYLECRSTNCGNNITFLLELLREKGIAFKSMILCQDAAMQLRMEAGLRKYVAEETVIISYAAYQANVVCREGKLDYEKEIYGMWDMDRYVNLLMGEIPRLRDNEEGYGPKGKGYIAHVEIPEQVLSAFKKLKAVYGEKTREANPLYASK